MVPFFSIVTITYNQENYIHQALDSVLSSDFEDIELIIGDDLSIDNTWQIINSYEDNRIKRYQNPVNIGEYPNRNKALSLAKGKFIFFIDGDDILYKHTLSNIYDYLNHFPDVGMVWGIQAEGFEFMVYPYVVNPQLNFKLMYGTTLPIGNVGFGEIIFKTDTLVQNGGFSEKYAHGDIYIKKKLALTNDVLYVSKGLTFWRKSQNQASQRVLKNHRSFIENIEINEIILKDSSFPAEESFRLQAQENLRISTIKLIISNTILKRDMKGFLYLINYFNIKLSDFFKIFKKGVYNFTPVGDISKPLINSYNLTSKRIKQ